MIYLPPAFFPSISYMSLVANDRVTIVSREQYGKQSYRNRADIMSANGKVAISVPVERYGYPPPSVSDIRISDHGDWRERLAMTIRSAYGSTPFFEHYEEELMSLMASPLYSLVEYDYLTLSFLCRAWGLDLPPLSHDAYPIDEYCRKLVDRHYVSPLSFPRYWQAFEQRYGFHADLSALDLLMNLGPEGRLYLLHLKG